MPADPRLVAAITATLNEHRELLGLPSDGACACGKFHPTRREYRRHVAEQIAAELGIEPLSFVATPIPTYRLMFPSQSVPTFRVRCLESVPVGETE